MKQAEPELLLLDNGSLEPAATLSLRRIAETLSLKLGRPVAPVSLLHSHKIPAEQTEGRPAETFERFVRRRAAEGQTAFAVLPLFFGPSGALVDYLPERIALLREKDSRLDIRLGKWLVDIEDKNDERVCSLLADCLGTRLTAEEAPETRAVILVDHGSPKKPVNAVREHLAGQLRRRLASRVNVLLSASMERRPEPEYDFNEPLLERAFERLPSDVSHVFVSQLFFSPGRHAGPGGDIEQICKLARARNTKLELHFSALVGTHPGLVEILQDRAASLLGS